MNDPPLKDRDHWEGLALSLDLTIEGQRLIAQEILWEMKAVWRWIGRCPGRFSLAIRRVTGRLPRPV